MLANRVSNVVLCLGLVALATLTAGQAVATARVVTATKPGVAQTQAPATGGVYPTCPFSKAELLAMQLVYVPAINRWRLETPNGPLGVDGGLSALRDCHRDSP